MGFGVTVFEFLCFVFIHMFISWNVQSARTLPLSFKAPETDTYMCKIMYVCYFGKYVICFWVPMNCSKQGLLDSRWVEA